MVNSRFSPVNPGAISAISTGVTTTPTSTNAEVISTSKEAIAPATFPASSFASRANKFAYTGMNDAESTPSPNRFCKKLGMRKAARNASAESELPK